MWRHRAKHSRGATRPHGLETDENNNGNYLKFADLKV
jgi:hypothetical protein